MQERDHRWHEADQILDAALDLPAAERPAFVAAACGDDGELLSLVERLLEHCGDDESQLIEGGALQGELGRELDSVFSDPGDSLEGRTVGRYRVLRELGRGGMAVVYLAERSDGDFEQLVALKLMRPGADNPDMVRRFHRERQILALTRHPNIAQLLDAGVTADGRSYLVMEYVEGEAIDSYCDRRRLGVDERLRLFIKVGRAVEVAHRNLVIHRDIKPSNILVTGDGDVKLLDFGIAKLLDDDREQLTRTNVRAMTPAFASPEQIDGAAITTATDVYQLGVLLYLLLAGAWPYHGSADSEAAMLLAVCTAPPSRPSSVIAGRRSVTPLPGGRKLSVAEIAAARRTTPGALRRRLAGDLDAMVLTALRKEPDRRYSSVAQQVADVQRLLDGRTVIARPETMSYRLRTFVRRHRVASVTAVVSAFVVLALGVYHTVEVGRERDRARLEAAKAREVSGFLKGLFEISAPTRSRGEAVTARELLDRGAARLDSELAGEPVLRAQMMTVIGDVYRELALYDEAQALLQRAVDIVRQQREAEPTALAEALFTLGRVEYRLGELAPARAALEESLELYESSVGRGDAVSARVIDALGEVARVDGELDAAGAMHREAIATLEARLGPGHPDVGRAVNRLAVVLQEQREYELSAELFERAIAIFTATLGADHPFAASARFNLAHSLRFSGQVERADELYNEVLPQIAATFGDEHPNVAVVLNNHANLLRAEGRFDEAEHKLQRAYEIWSTALGADHPQVAWVLNNLGLVARSRGDLDTARDYFERSVKVAEAAFGPEHADVATNLKNLALAMHELGDSASAEPLLQRAVHIRERVYGSGHSFVGDVVHDLAGVQLTLGKVDEAEASLRRAIDLGRDDAEHRADEITEPTIELAQLLATQGRIGEAEALLQAEAERCGDELRPMVEQVRDELADPESNSGVVSTALAVE